ncbi:hypothetical protein A9B99_04220 [Mangrovibacter phragmitis]|uniref:Uncharacterized protein n=1 Tax=Mangrovibacter phragmitis TaxID=1691903 RepID=A0A1B7L981_9ENTR|nr:hypothetical protein A9B99_04220 [Mangrovibacter phragmitis]
MFLTVFIKAATWVAGWKKYEVSVDVPASILAMAESDSAAVAGVTRNNNVKPSLLIHMTVTVTDKQSA